ncbi:MAG TPA: sugar kinase [Polyangiaceae bacterium]|jgi:2-dehydro-3-deoxygluconokinase|nr:sugar kinase [Polyangiaceae bacterium]
MARVTTFGELMLRLKTPGFSRFGQATNLEATFGGGEANVAVSLALFGHEARWISCVPKNAIGDWALASLRGLGVDTAHVRREGERLGIYFLESGASQRASQVVYDRAGSAVSGLQSGQISWKDALAGASWFHTTGISPALSDSCAQVTLEALVAARELGATTSVDLNYRKKLWSKAKAKQTMSGLMAHTDVLIANEEDCDSVFDIRAGHVESGSLDHERYLEVAHTVLARFPALRQVAITLRESKSASENGWSALLVDRDGHAFSRHYDVTVIDRVGAGDSFAAGLIHALLGGRDRQAAVDFAAAASALKHTVPGDFNLVSLAEVEALAGGDGSGRVQR